MSGKRTDEQGAIAQPLGASVEPEDSVEAVEAMLAAHDAYDNPCVAALEQARFERDQLQRTIDRWIVEERATRVNQAKIREVIERERDQARAHCRELAQTLKDFMDRWYGQRERERAERLLAAHPEWLR